MKNTIIILLMSFVTVLFFGSCKPEEATVTFTISDATDVSSNSATFKIVVTANVTLTENGICYSMQNAAPTTENSKIYMGSAIGAFSVILTDLTENTDYYARPYAIANGKTYYGTVKMFKTEFGGIMINGVKWATRNVGAHGQFVANPEDFGGYYQWGRKGDGHEQPTSSTTTTLSITNNPGHSNFILTENEPFDWRVPQNDVLWNAGSETSPVKAANDPCPTGWRVPTYSELQSLLETVTMEWSNLNGVDGYFIGDGEPKLFLPAAGYRSGSDGSLGNVGILGSYWISTPGGTLAYTLGFFSDNFYMYNGNRALGFSVRCVSE